MKVLLIRIGGRINKYSNSEEISGAEIYNINFLKALRNHKEIDIVMLTNSQTLSKRLLDLKIKSYVIKLPISEIGTKRDFLKAVFFSPFIVISYLKKIKDIERGIRFDVICLESMTEKIFLSPMLKALGYRVIWIEHGPLFITDRFSLIKKLYRLISLATSKIVSVSTDTKKDLLTSGISLKKLAVIPSAIDINYFSPIKKEEKEKLKRRLKINNKLVIGYSGGINKEKGIEEFLQTAEILCKKNKDIIFLLVGDGPCFNWAKERIKILKIDKAFLLVGFQKKIKNYLNVMDIFFFPTNHYEGLSLSLLEAAAMELLIVTHDIGGNREVVVDRVTGSLYKKFEVKKVLKLLLQFTKHYDKYTTIRKNARKLVVENYTIDAMAEKYNNLFASL